MKAVFLVGLAIAGGKDYNEINKIFLVFSMFFQKTSQKHEKITTPAIDKSIKKWYGVKLLKATIRNLLNLNPKGEGMKRVATLLLAVVCLLVPAGTRAESGDFFSTDDLAGFITETSTIPYYFFVIHCEPMDDPQVNWPVLVDMVNTASGANIPLTVMFSAPWFQYVAESPERTVLVQKWQTWGHEIGLHRHDIRVDSWDGYSNYPSWAIDHIRAKGQLPSAPLKGSLGELMSIAGYPMAGCAMEEDDKMALPSDLSYSTCSGYYNYGPVGTSKGSRTENRDPWQGLNQYSLLGRTDDGAYHLWLSHFLVASQEALWKVKEVFASLNSADVYGMLFHANNDQLELLREMVEFLSNLDGGLKAKTITQVMEEGILPVEYMGDVPQYRPR